MTLLRHKDCRDVAFEIMTDWHDKARKRHHLLVKWHNIGSHKPRYMQVMESLTVYEEDMAKFVPLEPLGPPPHMVWKPPCA